MKEFIIDETFNQLIINPEGLIEISGLSWKDASNIRKDAESANMTCGNIVHLGGGDRYCIDIKVEHDCIVLTKDKLSVVLNPENYPVEDIVINIK